MKNILYVSNIAGKQGVDSFSISAVDAAHGASLCFHIAANYSQLDVETKQRDEDAFNVRIHHIDLARVPYSPKNIRAYKQLCQIIRDEQIDYIHCNTPTGGLLGRLAGKKCKVKKVIYQAHGFHFYKGAPRLNWLIYYPIEKGLAHHTDALITINREDYKLAKNKFHLRNNGQVYYVPGVGIDLSQYAITVHAELRDSLGIGENDVMLISAGDMVERKNYKLAIEAIAKTNLQNLKYCICGKGPQLDELKAYADSLGVADQILFLGFRSDMKELLQVADIFLFTTKQEGLPCSMMEAMASGLPCIASRVRGNTDLLEDGIGGYLCDVDSPGEFTDAIKKLAENSDLRKQFGDANLKHIREFDITEIANQVCDIYVSEYQTSENERGGGINSFELSEFYPVRVRKRLELGLSLEDVVLISVGRLDANKNNETAIRAVAKVPNVKLLLCGEGELRESLEGLAKSLDIEDRVIFLGNRTDMLELYQTADIFVMMSFREGLSRSIMEAMASGLPCIVSKIRGNVDLLEDGVGGYLCSANDTEALANAIARLTDDAKLRKKMALTNLERIHGFDVKVVIEKIGEIYQEVLSK